VISRLLATTSAPETASVPETTSAPRPRPRLRPTRGGLSLLSLLLGCGLLLPALGAVPGLHGDEAWVGLRADEIARGARPSTGMNEYTGPIHQYMLVPWLSAFGYSVGALRLFTALTSLLAVYLYFRVVKRLYGVQCGAVASLLLVSFPFFSICGRQATESFALNPVLLMLSAELLLRGNRSSTAAAGILLALGVWNHLIFLPIPILMGAAVWLNAPAGARIARASTLAAGFAAGLAPMLLGLLGTNGPGLPWRDKLGEVLPGFAERLATWPDLFLAFLHGDVLFLRVVGDVRWPTLPVLPSVFLLSCAILAIRALRGSDPERRRTLQLFAGFGSLFVLTALICPDNSDRYQLLPLFAAPLVLARLFALLLERPTLRRLGVGGLVCVLLLQLGRISINYFHAYRESGGGIATYELAGMPETSNHFVDTRALYEVLVAVEPERVVAEFFIGVPLRFHDLAPRKLRIALVEEHRHPVSLGPNDRLVVYRGGLRRVTPEDFPGVKTVAATAHFLVLAPAGRLPVRMNESNAFVRPPGS